MRADRLIATLLLLQQRGRVTAAEVARELEISVPTARRDLAALSAAGVPVYPQPGWHGGWELVGGARTDLSGLTADEARALFVLLGARTDGSDPALATALRKLGRALPATFRAAAEAAAGAVHVDASAWGGRVGEADLPHRRELERAVIERLRVRIEYADRAGRRSTRTIDPWGLVAKGDSWYLIAGTERGRRTFRADRIEAVTVTGEAAERPDDLDLGEAWQETVAVVEARRGRVVAEVVIEPARVEAVRRFFGRHLAMTDTPVADGMVGATIAAHTVTGLAEQLAGWCGVLRVTGPPEVRAELARIGRELVAVYS